MPPPGRTVNIVQAGTVILVIIILALIVVVVLPLSRPPPSPEEPLTIAGGTLESSILTVAAEEKGFFKENGLNVTFREYPAGAYAVKELLSGTADIACAAEFVGVTNSFRSPDLRIIAITAKSNAIVLIARNDRGISTPADMRGKTIAFSNGTIAEFFLGRHLTLNGMTMQDITARHLGPSDVVKSVVSGDADAAVVWDPYQYQIEQQLGRNFTVLSVQDGQSYYWVTYTRSDVIRTRPELIRRYLRALDASEDYVSLHEDEAKKILARRMNITDEYANRTWQKNRYGLSLDQGLILAMEDEARWMAVQNMTGGKTPPSYLDMIYQDAMRETKPGTVTVIR